MSSTLASGIFDPTLMPVRSCLRMDDKEVSNKGTMLRKSVTFNDTSLVHDDVNILVVLPSSFTTHRLNTQLLPPPPQRLSINNPYRRQKELRVTFFPFCTVIEPEGRCYTFPVALEQESEHWKPEAMDGETLYIIYVYLFMYKYLCI